MTPAVPLIQNADQEIGVPGGTIRMLQAGAPES